ncbi:MAG: hypothetical protein GX567_01660 [Clostridia bacterium]|nr:hypothetical protein [Clostridia bacterium]
MVLYVAICNDSIADRKQLERQFSREKERRLPDPVLYIDSFGSKEALTDTPVKYDLILLEHSAATDQETLGGKETAFAEHLRQVGIAAPLFLTSAAYDTSDSILRSDSLLHLKLPLSNEQIKELINVSIDYHQHKRPLMEIRNEKITHYIDCADIIYALEDHHLTKIYLTKDRSVSLLGTIEDFARMVPEPDYFGFAGKHGVINLKRAVSKKTNAFIMENKDVVHFSFLQYADLLPRWKKFKNQ